MREPERTTGTSDGVVAVNKAAGPTSHDVVDRARRALRVRRVGHLGTLDPTARGVLVLVVGRATRLAPYAAAWLKTYEGVIRFDRATTTDDATGETVEATEAWRGLAEAAVSQALAGFVGGYAQRPPAYSALKVGGERAYRRARRGEAVTLAPRRVAVRAVELLEWAPPAARFRAVVGAGTYLRSLARDAGAALGCAAHLAALERTAVGPFTLADAVDPDALSPADLRDASVLVADLPRRELDATERAAVVHGRPIAAGNGQRATGDGQRATLRESLTVAGNVVLFWRGELVAVAEVSDGFLKPRAVLAAP
jgi:tRNA pseudouridine55 synthase